MRRIAALLSLVALLLGVMAISAVAQVPPHDHFLTVPGTGESVRVGPARCELGETVQGAFLNFHFKVHIGTPASTGGLAIAPQFCP